MDERSDWTWRYSMWTGIMYGPIPVGIILVLIAAVAYLAFGGRWWRSPRGPVPAPRCGSTGADAPSLPRGEVAPGPGRWTGR